MVQGERCPMTWGEVCWCRRTLKRDEHGTRFILHPGMRGARLVLGNVGLTQFSATASRRIEINSP
jgi:hypothetical protein